MDEFARSSMKLLWVTSFSPALYRATGHCLIESFLDTHSEGDLLLCTESDAASSVAHPRILRIDLDRSRILRSWLAANHDMIPREFGGGAGPCDCPARSIFRGHRSGCVNGWWNRNASRWFRKVVSMHRAARLPGYGAVIWLDSDCIFRKPVSVATAKSWFGGADVFLLKSPDRAVVESGILGFRGTGGRRFVSLTMDRFRSGEFRRDSRWDDGYQFQRVLDLHPEIPRADLATHVTGDLHVVANSPVGEFLAHDKGVHARARLTW